MKCFVVTVVSTSALDSLSCGAQTIVNVDVTGTFFLCHFIYSFSANVEVSMSDHSLFIFLHTNYCNILASFRNLLVKLSVFSLRLSTSLMSQHYRYVIHGVVQLRPHEIPQQTSGRKYLVVFVFVYVFGGSVSL